MNRAASFKSITPLLLAVVLLAGTEMCLGHRIHGLRAEAEAAKRAIIADVVELRGVTVRTSDSQQEAAAELKADLAATPEQIDAAARDAVSEAQRQSRFEARLTLQAQRTRIQQVERDLAFLRSRIKATADAAFIVARELYDVEASALVNRGAAREARLEAGRMRKNLEALRNRTGSYSIGSADTRNLPGR